MKKLFILTFLLSAFIGLSAFAQLSTNGLVSFFPFNGNANDANIIGDSGTVYGATLTTDRFGNANSAYLFNGINNYISISTTDLINLNTYSYSVWVKPTATPTNYGNAIFEIGGATNINTGDGYGQGISFETDQTFFGGSYNIGSNPTQSYIRSDTNTLNKWYHLVSIRNDSLMKFYINGKLIKSSSTALTNGEVANYGNVNQKNAIIGGRCFLKSTYFFTGVIDDFSIFNRAITQAEIDSIYHAGGWQIEKPINTLDSGLIARYPFNGNANDESINKSDGTVYGATLTKDRFGKINSAYSYDGVNNYISIPTSKLINLNNYSYSIWVKPTATPINYGNTVFEVGGATNYNIGDGFGQGISCETNQTFFGGSYNVGSTPKQSYLYSSPFMLNNWYHIVSTRNDSTMKLYINGNLVNSSSTALTNGEPANYGNVIEKNAIIGGRCFLNPSYFFTGIIDDFSIYNRNLTQAEIDSIYHQGGWPILKPINTLDSGLIANYPFNGNANDESIFKSIGTVNGATLTKDRFGNVNSAYSFDGKSNYISIPSNQLINLNTYSYSVWVKPTATPTNYGNIIFEIGGATNINTGDGYGQGISCETNQTFFGGSYNVGSNPIQSYLYSNPFMLNNWYHIVSVRNDSTMKLFINGNMVASTSKALTKAEPANYGNVSQKNAIIGGRCFLNPTYFFTGIIDDFRIYNRELNPTEILALKNDNKNSVNLSTDTIVAKTDNKITDSITLPPIDTCVFDYNAPIDSFYIASVQISNSQMHFNWVFKQDGNTFNFIADVDINKINNGYYLMYLTIQCNEAKKKGILSNTFAAPYNITTLAVNEIKQNNLNISIYPNPANDKIIIETYNQKENYNLEILTSTGQVVLTKKITNMVEQIDLSGISAGIYFVKLQSENNTIVKKIIKQN